MSGANESRPPKRTAVEEAGQPEVSVTAPACPDCGEPVAGGRIVHADTCPLMAGLERGAADDRDWFARHPGEAQRTRNTTPAERSELRMYGIDPDRRVVITRVARGSYLRRFVPSDLTDLLVVAE